MTSTPPPDSGTTPADAGTKDVGVDATDGGTADAEPGDAGPGDSATDGSNVDGGPSAAGIVAYAWADQSTTASYAPSALYAFNSGGGAITATRSGPGVYEITFAGLTVGGGGDVQVTAYQSTRHCNVEVWGGSKVGVKCFDPAGAAADSPYLIAITRAGVVTNARVEAYAWANDSVTASYTPSPTYTYAVGGGAITASRTAAGTYQMTFTGVALAGTNVQVSAYLSNRSCNAGIYTGASAVVHCYDAAGNPADSSYTIQVLRAAGTGTPNVLAYVWADQAASASYTPDPTYAFSSGSGPITATRTSAGNYTLAFPGVDFTKASVKVTAYGSNAVCNVENYSGSTAKVQCWNGTTATDSRFTLLAVSK